MMMLKSLIRVRTLKIFEDSGMSHACGMWHVRVFIAASCNIIKNMWIPLGAVKGIWCSFHVSVPGIDTQQE
jgi:hypothetical protein